MVQPLSTIAIWDTTAAPTLKAESEPCLPDDTAIVVLILAG
jgi:hypothetical protein